METLYWGESRQKNPEIFQYSNAGTLEYKIVTLASTSRRSSYGMTTLITQPVLFVIGVKSVIFITLYSNIAYYHANYI